MKVSGVYADYFEMIKKTLFNQFGNPANCLQAKGFLVEINNAIIQAENELYGDVMQARLDALNVVAEYLQKWIANNCNEEGTSTIIDVEPTPSYPGTGGEYPVGEDYNPEPNPTTSNKTIWILGAALIGFIVYTNNKRNYRRKASRRRK